MGHDRKKRPTGRFSIIPWWVGSAILAALLAGFVWWLLPGSEEGKQRRKSDRSPDSRRDVPAWRLPDEAVFAGYAGSAQCSSCHQREYELWKDSHHQLAEREIELAKDHHAFEPTREISHGSQTTVAQVQNGKVQLVATGKDGKEKAFAVDRVIGTEPLRQFLVKGASGRYQATELAYDPNADEWFDVYGEEDRRPGEWGHWTGRGMTWNQMCASCHNTRLRKHYREATDSYHTTMAERSVGCEACHGPMKEHVQWQNQYQETGRSDPTIPVFTRDQKMQNCAPCHARRGEATGEFRPGEELLDHYILTIPDDTDVYYADGQVREENYEYVSFLSSKMHGAGVSCMDCHNPHSAKVLDSGNSLCMRCHGPPQPPAPRIDPSVHMFHTPETAGGRCVDCHMPETVYMQRDPRRDHGFPIPDPLMTIEHGIPNACNRCHTEKDAQWALGYVKAWYGERMERDTRDRTRLVARAREGKENAVPELMKWAREETNQVWKATAAHVLGNWLEKPGVTKLLMEMTRDRSPLVRRKAVVSLAPFAGTASPSVGETLGSLLEDPVRSVRLAAAWGLKANLDTNTVPGKELLHYLSINSDQPIGAMQKGGFYVDRGRPEEALTYFQRAVEWDPYSAALRESLAICLSRLGRPEAALEQIKQACALAPNEASYRYLLGLAWSEAGNVEQAVKALEQAVELDSQFSRAWYNLGLGYSALGREYDALETLQRAEELDTSSPDFPYARATIYLRLQRFNEARSAAEKALDRDPQHTPSILLLRRLPQP